MKEFEIKSGKIVASDPCYELDTWCMGIIENVKNGTWYADIEDTTLSGWGNRVAKLRIEHSEEMGNGRNIEKLDFDAGVDSGQFGFFDFDTYRNDKSIKGLPKADYISIKKDGDEWYSVCCNKTYDSKNSEVKWGTLPNGVVSSSGLGDGSYEVFGQKNRKGEWVAFEVVFIDESADDDDDNGFDDDY